MLTELYGDSAPSLTSVKYWTIEIKPSRTSNFDEDHPHCPNELSNSEMMQTIYDWVLSLVG